MLANISQRLLFRLLAINRRRLPDKLQRRFMRLRDVGYDKAMRREHVVGRQIAIHVREYARPVTQPLVLISQTARSGGTLLSQLLDGHPECYAHPSELQIGKPKYEWPNIDISDSPHAIFDRLFEPASARLLVRGYRKGRHAERMLFAFSPVLQKQVFLDCMQACCPTQRRAFNAYFTSYFNAWLNYQTAFHPKKLVSAFAPELATHADSLSRFFAAYPDGRVISIVRNPLTWFPSRRDHAARSKPAELTTAISSWCRGAQAIADNKARYGDCYRVVRFEDLVLDTATTMRLLAEWLGIAFDPILLLPTFNTIPTVANSSFSATSSGILIDATKRETTLSDRERTYIEGSALPLYTSLCKATRRGAAQASAATVDVEPGNALR